MSEPVPSRGLHLDFCSHEAAKHAVRTWYYRPEMPRGKLVRIGVWENGAFTGSIIFGMGSSDALGKRFGLTCFECCEMVRVAMGKHQTPASRIIAIALRILHKQSPGLRAAVSFCDPNAGHVGTIYQAMNWIYTGTTQVHHQYLTPDGRTWDSRSVDVRGFKMRFGVKIACPRPSECRIVPGAAKHRYVYPLDPAVRPAIEKFRLPFPKKSPETLMRRR